MDTSIYYMRAGKTFTYRQKKWAPLSPYLVNLKSNTMKNTLQSYEYFFNLQVFLPKIFRIINYLTFIKQKRGSMPKHTPSFYIVSRVRITSSWPLPPSSVT